MLRRRPSHFHYFITDLCARYIGNDLHAQCFCWWNKDKIINVTNADDSKFCSPVIKSNCMYANSNGVVVRLLAGEV